MSTSRGAVENWASAVDLIGRSWKLNRETTLDYSPAFIRSLVEYPGPGPVLAPALYDGRELIALVVGFPRLVRIEGEIRRLLLMSLLTVTPSHRGHGYAHAICVDFFQQARSAGYDGVLHYCVEGNTSNAVTVAAVQSAGFEARRVFRIRYMMRLLRPKAEPQPDPDPVSPQQFLNAVESLGSAVPFTRLWTPAEAEWQLRAAGRLSAADPAGGVITGYVLNVWDSAHTPCLFVEDVLWGRLAPEERAGLLSRFMTRAAGVATLAAVPVLGYADLSAFTAAGFRGSRRVLNAYLTLWNASPEVRQLPGMYADVL